jgi:small subunit ribosomal protein S20
LPPVPNKKSAIKRVRQNEKRRIRNKAKRSTMRTSIKKVREAIDTQNVEALPALLRDAQSKLDKAAKTNLIKKGNASRRVSRLVKAKARAEAAK